MPVGFEVPGELAKSPSPFNANSPGTYLQSLQAALQMGLILADEEQTWLAIADDRNRSVHTYHGKFAREMFDRIKNVYLPTFESCFSRLTQ
jgi:nucleotidyltransferase substrate binding protein (TIGR01987 family)